MIDFIKQVSDKIELKQKLFGLEDSFSFAIHDIKTIIDYCILKERCESIVGYRNYHLDRLDKVEENGYRLITIFEDEWINQQRIIQSKIQHILNKNNQKSVFARKCYIVDIKANIASDFCNKYHIQGNSPASIKLGAYHNGELVAVLTFGVPSLSKGNKEHGGDVYELARFCTSRRVVGIASKMMKHFQNNYKWSKIFTFADRRWSNGNLYRQIGFDNGSELVTQPNYFYFKSPSIKRIHRFNFRKDVLNVKLDKFDPDKTEYENMLWNGYSRIWDCGNYKWIIENPKYKEAKKSKSSVGVFFK